MALETDERTVDEVVEEHREIVEILEGRIAGLERELAELDGRYASHVRSLVKGITQAARLLPACAPNGHVVVLGFGAIARDGVVAGDPDFRVSFDGSVAYPGRVVYPELIPDAHRPQ